MKSFKILILFFVHIHCLERNKLTNKEIYANLKKSLESIKNSCGEICDQTIKGKPGAFFDHIKKNVDCEALFRNPDIDISSDFPHPPQRIPKWLLPDYNYGGRVEVAKNYIDEIAHSSDVFQNWPKDVLTKMREMIKNDTFSGPYGIEYVRQINTYMKDHIDIKGKDVLIIGSQIPWIEMIAMLNEAKSVTTIDYNVITTDYPGLILMTNVEFIEKYLSGKLPKYDVIVSFSSIEHSGLGRYGDNLNPWGDLIAMAKAWCVSKPSAKALIGFPFGKDRVVFNSHKIYGPVMLSHVFANWKLIHTNADWNKFSEECDWCYEPLFLLNRECDE